MVKDIEKRIKKIHKIINSVYNNCIGVGSLSKTKNAVEKIQKILEELECKENIK